MQNLSSVENLADTEASHWMSLKDLRVEVGSTPLGESDCNLNERTSIEEITNFEVMQQSLPVANNKERSCESFSESSYGTSEPSGSWGDFEGFRESDKSERFGHNLDVLGKSTKASGADRDLSRGCCSASAGHLHPGPSLHGGTQETSSSRNETPEFSKHIDELCPEAHAIQKLDENECRKQKIAKIALALPGGLFGPLMCLRSVLQTSSSSLLDEEKENHSYEDIFKLGFPEVFVSESIESIRSLDQVLDTNNEDAGIPELMENQLCIDSENIWRTLRDFDNTPSLRHPWSKSHCQENLLSVLGIDANQKSQDDFFEESNVKDNEDFRFDEFSINDCKALIQTKLSVSPDSRHGLPFTCNLFLKTSSSNGNTQYITIPRKKHIFTTDNLKMKFFSSDIC